MKFMKKIAAMAAATAVAAVSLVSMGSMGASATDEPPYTAYLCISAGGDAQWKAGDWETESATITGDGVYSTSVTIPEDKGSETIEFLMLSTDINAYAFAPEGTSNPVADGTAKITINSIKVVRVGSGEEAAIAYNGPSEHSMFLNDDGRTLRVNILNTWATAQNTTDIDPNVPGGLAAGDKVVVDFAVSGINAGGGLIRHLPLRHRRIQIRTAQPQIRARPLRQVKLRLPQQAAATAETILPTAAAATAVLPMAAAPAAAMVPQTMRPLLRPVTSALQQSYWVQ
ncbi:hypothetical protein [Ruminococcus sp.]|uniref:hypothetical protein n=1 Tax=Ruminococcus sp. TaxID=41978 RepID=UPI0035216F48